MNPVDKKIDDALNYYLGEAKRSSITRTTRNTKIKRATSQLASIEARKRGDSQYKQMKKFCDLCKKYRETIHKKYASRVRSKARR